MPDFFPQNPEETVFNLKDQSGKVMASIDAVDIVMMFRDAKLDCDVNGDQSNWFPLFSRSFLDATGVKLTKTSAVQLINEASNVFEAVKKNGLDESEQPESETPPSTTATEIWSS